MVFIMFWGPTGFFSFGGRRGPVVNHLNGVGLGGNTEANRNAADQANESNLSQVGFLIAALLLSSSGIPIEAILPLSTLLYLFHYFSGQEAFQSTLQTLGQVLLMLFTFAVLYYANATAQQSQQSENQRNSRAPEPRQASTDFSDTASSFIAVVYPFIFFCLLALQAFPDSFYRAWYFTHRNVSAFLPQRLRVFWNRVFGAFSSEIPTGSVPASKSVIQNLEEVVLQENHLLAQGTPYITCPICLENMRFGESVKRLECKHYFHGDCIIPWLEKHCTCPSCRHELRTDDPFYEEARRHRSGISDHVRLRRGKFT